MRNTPSPKRTGLPKSAEAILDKPFEGLFGDTAELRVLQEVIADPYSNYSQHDMMELTGLSDPSVRRGFRALVDHGIIRNISSARRNPLYRVNLESKKLLALTFLSYASLDERTGGSSMEDAVRDYCAPSDSHIDFLGIPDARKDSKTKVNGARVYLSDVTERRLGEMLEEALKKASKDGRLERLKASL